MNSACKSDQAAPSPWLNRLVGAFVFLVTYAATVLVVRALLG